MDILAKERSLPRLGQTTTTRKWESRSWPPQVAQQKLPVCLHELSFLLAQLASQVLLQRASARVQALASDLMLWRQFPEWVRPFSFSTWASASPRQFQSAPEDLPKSHPEAALRVHYSRAQECTQRRKLLGPRASEKSPPHIGSVNQCCSLTSWLELCSEKGRLVFVGCF
jgi:hypothetical protein